jgi:hypothetical protein
VADQDDVRRLALELPEVTENDDRFAFSVGTKGIAWVWLERSAPKAPRVPNDGVLAVRVAGEAGKQELLAADPDKFFTEPHYNGYPAVLVRLAAVDEAELRELLVDAWRIQAPKTLVKQHPDL